MGCSWYSLPLVQLYTGTYTGDQSPTPAAIWCRLACERLLLPCCRYQCYLRDAQARLLDDLERAHREGTAFGCKLVRGEGCWGAAGGGHMHCRM